VLSSQSFPKLIYEYNIKLVTDTLVEEICEYDGESSGSITALLE
jgi:hypothetical protein